MAHLHAVLHYLRESLWFVPAIFAIGSLIMAALLLFVDDALIEEGHALPLLYGGSVDGAREVLSTIATSMLTFTGLVFTVTMLVLQQASSQLSPRVLRTFLRDRGTQTVLGLFVATFLYTLIVLRYVRSPADNGEEFIPGLSIGIGFLLLLASVGAFIYYIDHMAQAIRASNVIHSIADEARRALDDLFPERIGEAATDTDEAALPNAPPVAVVGAPRAGVLIQVDESSLLTSARDGEHGGDRFVELVPLVGDYVAEGAPLFRLWGNWPADEQEGLAGTAEFGSERSVGQDLRFGFRQLIDIAVRALSAGVNDPTTAVQALDRVHDLLRRLAGRRIPEPLRRDAEETVRLYLRRPGWEDYVVLATEEIRLAGESQLQVMRRLRLMLLDVMDVAPAERRPAIERALARLERSVERGLPDDFDQRLARADGVRGQDLAGG